MKIPIRLQGKYPTEITEEVFEDLYENLKDDIMWFCKNKGIPFDEQEDVFHDTMEAVWRDRDGYKRLSAGRSPATFVYLKLKNAVMEYFNRLNTGKKEGNIKAKTKMNTFMRSYDQMFLQTSGDDAECVRSNHLSLVYDQIEEHNSSYAEAFNTLDKLPEVLRMYVQCKCLADDGRKKSISEKVLVQIMKEHGLPVRHRSEESEHATVYAYEDKLKRFLQEDS